MICKTIPMGWHASQPVPSLYSISLVNDDGATVDIDGKTYTATTASVPLTSTDAQYTIYDSDGAVAETGYVLDGSEMTVKNKSATLPTISSISLSCRSGNTTSTYMCTSITQSFHTGEWASQTEGSTVTYTGNLPTASRANRCVMIYCETNDTQVYYFQFGTGMVGFSLTAGTTYAFCYYDLASTGAPRSGTIYYQIWSTTDAGANWTSYKSGSVATGSTASTMATRAYGFYVGTAMPGTACGQLATSDGTIYDTTTTGTYAITGITGTSLTVPNSVSIQGSDWTVSCPSFKGDTTLTSVSWDLDTVPANQFYYCTALTSITLGEDVTDVGDYAFFGCTGVRSMDIKSTALADGLTTANSKFYYLGGTSTTAGTVNVTFEEGVTRIPDYFFSAYGNSPYSAPKLLTVSLPSTLEYIGTYAFNFCQLFTTITFPNGQPAGLEIGSEPLREANALASIVNGDVQDDVWYAGTKAVFLFRSSALTDVVVKDGTTEICGGFASYNKFVSLTIPDSVTSMGSYSLWSCTSLTTLTLPIGLDAVVSTSAPAFYGCSGIRTVTFTGAGSFDYTSSTCSYTPWRNATSITFSDGVTSIGNYLCRNCSSATISLPDSVTSFGIACLFGTKLDTLDISASVASIGQWAFAGCKSLPAITVADDNASYCSVDGVLYDKDMNDLMQCPGGKTGEFTVPDGVRYIDGYAFYNCTGLTSVVLNQTVSTVYDYTFYGCSGLTSVTIPDSVTTINNYAFSGCTGVTEVTFGTGLTTLSSSAFGSWTFYDSDGTTTLDKTVASNLAGFTFVGTASALVKQVTWYTGTEFTLGSTAITAERVTGTSYSAWATTDIPTVYQGTAYMSFTTTGDKASFGAINTTDGIWSYNALVANTTYVVSVVRGTYSFSCPLTWALYQSDVDGNLTQVTTGSTTAYGSYTGAYNFAIMADTTSS